jgi:hypothetical protein
MYTGFNLSYPVMEIDGEVYGTIQSVAGELGVSAAVIRNAMHRHKDLFPSNKCVTDCYALTFLQGLPEHGREFGLKNLKGNVRLLPRKEMRQAARLVHSEKAREYQEKLDEVVEAHWGLNTVPKEVFEQEHALRVEAEKQAAQAQEDRAEMRRELCSVKGRVSVLEKKTRLADEARAAEEKAASAAGAALNAHKGTKAFREGIN